MTPKWFYLKVLPPTAVTDSASGGSEEPVSFQGINKDAWSDSYTFPL